MAPESPGGPAESTPELRLSYKFQRLRERIRAAITSGELAGKLPGERELAKRFKVNTKTLSKALSELAADGLVERNIGLGTFVRGSGTRETLRVLFAGNVERINPVAKLVDPATMQVTVQAETSEASLNAARYDCIVLSIDRTSDDVVRDLMLRGRRVITVGTRATRFSTWAVLYDVPAAAADLARRIAHRGHRKLMVVGADPDGEVMAAVHSAVRDTAEAVLGGLTDLDDCLAAGATALILLPAINPKQVADYLAHCQHRVPDDMSVVTIGWQSGASHWTGVGFTPQQVCDAIMQLADPHASPRPASLWLAGSFHDAGTLGPAPAAGPASPRQP